MSRKHRVLLIGSGGREHALAKAMVASPQLEKLFIAPGNPGTARLGQNVPIQVEDIRQLLTFAQENHITLTIVGPENPLVMGIVDLFEKAQLNIIGPNQHAAQLEGSKTWSKALMKEAGIPTASSQSFSTYETATSYIKETNQYPVVIKADGLAAGKGVTIAHSENEAVEALKACFIDQVFDSAGSTVLIEDFLIGEEASILAFCDGKTIVPMVSAQDHKAINDGDKGPNTGGMGAYSPAPIVTSSVERLVQEQVFTPLLSTFKKRGLVYKGIIYAGLIIHNGLPKVIEFNARFGDPETQVVLARLNTDILKIFQAIIDEALDKISIDWRAESSVCVVIAAGGYPGSYKKSDKITGIEDAEKIPHISVIQAGTKLEADQLVTNGGRVLGVVSTQSTLKSAIDSAYLAIEKIKFNAKYFRTDIGKKAL